MKLTDGWTNVIYEHNLIEFLYKAISDHFKARPLWKEVYTRDEESLPILQTATNTIEDCFTN